MSIPAHVSDLTTLGFAIVHTGGGCQAWELPLANGLYLSITDGEAALPEERGTAWLGLMSLQHGEPLMERTFESLQALVDELKQSRA